MEIKYVRGRLKGQTVDVPDGLARARVDQGRAEYVERGRHAQVEVIVDEDVDVIVETRE